MEVEDEVDELLLDLFVGLVAVGAGTVAEQAERVCWLAIHRCSADVGVFVVSGGGEGGGSGGRRALFLYASVPRFSL